MSTPLYRAPRFPLVHAELDCPVLQSWASGCSREPAPHLGIELAESPEEIALPRLSHSTLQQAGLTPCVCVPFTPPSPEHSTTPQPTPLRPALDALAAQFSFHAAAGLIAGQTLLPRASDSDDPEGFRPEPAELTDALTELALPYHRAALEASVLAELLGSAGLAVGFPISPFRRALEATLRTRAEATGLPRHASTPLLRLSSRLAAHAELPATLADLAPLPEDFLRGAEAQLVLHAASAGLDVALLTGELELLRRALELARPLAYALPDEVFVISSWRRTLLHAPQIAPAVVLAERAHLGEDLALRLPGFLHNAVSAELRSARLGSSFLPLGTLRPGLSWTAAAPVALALYRDAAVPAHADATTHNLAAYRAWELACDACTDVPLPRAALPAASLAAEGTLTS